MPENRDVIAQPCRGRFFPVTVAEIKQALQNFQFACSPYQKRLDIIFRNSDKIGPSGRCIAALYPPYKVVIYSVPEGINHQRAKIVLDKAMCELAEFGKEAKLYDRRRESLFYCVYDAPQGALIITKCLRKGIEVKYRRDSKFSNTFKSKGIKTDEQIIKSVSLI